jgi:hypothetical protein
MDHNSGGPTKDGVDQSVPGFAVQGDVQSEVSAIETVIARLATLQKDMDDVKKSIVHLKSCMDCIVLSSGATNIAKDVQSIDSRVMHLLLPVNNVFNTEYVAVAVNSALPSFILQHVKGRALKDVTGIPERLLAALMFSTLPTEKRLTICTPAGRLHSDLKLLVARLLVLNSRSRAKEITKCPRNSQAVSSVDDERCSQSDIAGSGHAEQSPIIQVEWMAPGYVRPEIYEEVRIEIDGPCGLGTETRSKRRKLSHEAELKENVGKALIKALYPKIHTFLRTARDQARKVFVKQLGYVFRPEAEASIMFLPEEISTSQEIADIHEIPQTYPRSSSETADDAENLRMFENIGTSSQDMHVRFEYSVSVIDKTGNRDQKRVRKCVNIFACALNFCIGFTQCSNPSHFFRISKESLRMVYVIALAFRSMLVQYQDLRESCSRRGDTLECQKEMRALHKTWENIMPGDVVTDRILRDGILWMTPLQYEERHPVAEDRSIGKVIGEPDGEENEFDEDIAHIEFRMS